MSRNISVSETSRPVLPRHAKLKFDETRKVWVILAPERVLAPDEIAVEVLQLCDGERSVAEMVDQLAAKYAAPREAIAIDVVAMLQDLDGDLVGRQHPFRRQDHPDFSRLVVFQPGMPRQHRAACLADADVTRPGHRSCPQLAVLVSWGTNAPGGMLPST